MRKSKIIIAFVISLIILCFISVAVYLLVIREPGAPENKAREIAILRAAGLVGEAERSERDISALYHERIIPRQLDLKRGQLLPAVAGQSPAFCNAPADGERTCERVEIYLVKGKSGDIQQVILPVNGKGAKSMMYAFVALDTDGTTVKGINYYQQNETPLLGARVADPEWRSQWPGKRLLDEQGQPALKVVQDNTGPHDDHTVDGISGATMTSSGVEKSINYWMGERGFGPFLQRLRADKDILTP
ncbi:NADH:ubiquinone reductase (Na(+)-transporting) subunit C [Superficieibacter electus]|uniref:Na(+)-translocating NADH-quinone reductase subunit C n=1 Tax=Superficieibacter electus TaxID=2022662 RepID=A0A2P5GL26_9ENTR|nr:NADH:ubiquinone reductase (Na(+)-transporting) subunit C [Superficieibacter electus]POP42653.1 NADH:ubiquinone reductase (Na(+)-transporting) subunit C [Superficieibacter electus]POP45729.1 NADH:ubiquinone reductase (Na(+)-transporting) subunit C [Superficieibacter electus]